MNIIAGRHRGRKLKSLPGQATRPVLGRTREALFNVIGEVAGLRVLDLFAGTGALGLEALSRGADELVAVEQSRAACRIIRENRDLLGEAAEVVQDEASRALRRLAADGRMFDLVFIDAPYGKGLSQEAVTAVFGNDLLAGGSLVAATVRRDEPMPGDGVDGQTLPAGARVVFDRRYGDTRLVIYTRDILPEHTV